MDPRPRNLDKVAKLLQKGVEIPNPWSLDIGDEVDVDRISPQGVCIHPGCRIRGGATAISSGAVLGAEAPVTVDDCQIGPGVQLNGGFFQRAVFLRGAGMGLGAHVRGGTLLEEQASGAHCVGLKQTILFPFVTLGSLINFCDCLMAGGTSRRDHSEVGSSYIHFNFTPDGDKATPSLIGDVPQGVMLRKPPIFLGGQGGMVGPLHLGFGNVAAAGTVMRSDLPAEGKLILGERVAAGVTSYTPGDFGGLIRKVRNNLHYLASLVALTHWYRQVRRPFLLREELGEPLYAGALACLDSAIRERRDRLGRLIAMIEPPPGDPAKLARRQRFTAELVARGDAVLGLFDDPAPSPEADRLGEGFMAAFRQQAGDAGDYIQAVQGLPPETAAAGTAWLERIVSDLMEAARRELPSMDPPRHKPAR